jgi:hypothetical protein
LPPGRSFTTDLTSVIFFSVSQYGAQCGMHFSQRVSR